MILDDTAIDRLFRTARTTYAWSDEPVEDDTIRRIYDLARLGPTSANCSPARFVFLRTREARERLLPALSPGNVEKTMSAPVVVVAAWDPLFYDRLPALFPHADARSWFAGDAGLAEETAFRNATLQGAYLILAARALGLDAGPMSGFDRAVVDATLLAGQGWKSNFLINLGHAGGEAAKPRDPRLAFEDACLML